MSDATRPNTMIAGAGDVSGGTYGDVTIAGVGTVRGDLDATVLKIAGTAEMQGKVVAGTVLVNGVGTFAEDVSAGELAVNGTASIHGGVSAGLLKVAGVCTVDGAVKAEKVEVKGSVKIGGDVQAESFDSQGVFSVAGLLNAGDVTVKLYGGCDAHDIGGETIDVRLAPAWTFLPFIGERNLTADTVEGDKVYLENTRAKVVRGAKVEIGPGCAIDLVEYTDSLTGSAGVTASRKVAAGA